MIRNLAVRAIKMSALGTVAMTPMAEAAFLEDSKASLQLRNFYFNRDYRQDGGKGSAGQSQREEWAQGFIFKYESGFTEGPIGVGVDVLALWGVKLDSGKGRSGTELMPVQNDGRAPSNFGNMGATLKLRYSKSDLRVGTLIPMLTSVRSNDSRLLPTTWRGVHLVSQEIDDLTINIGQLWELSERSNSRSEHITMKNRGMTGLKASDHFDFAGLDYAWTPTVKTGYHYSNLQDNYHQHFFTFNHTWTLDADRAIKSDLRFARSSDDGDSNVDNRMLGAKFTYLQGGHEFAMAYQKMTGDTGFATLESTSPYLVNYVQLGDFANKDEKSWQVRYDYDFAAIGIPGLTFMTRYLSGYDFDRGDGRNGEEWERDSDLEYVFQSGLLKDLGVRWRNATKRSNHKGDDIDENRLILSYTIPLL